MAGSRDRDKKVVVEREQCQLCAAAYSYSYAFKDLPTSFMCCYLGPTEKKKDVITNESSSVNNKSRQLERSYLEEILIKEDVEPKTTSEKVGKAASNTFAYFAFALGVCALGGLGYALFDSFFGSDSPQKIYSKCLKLIKNDERCIQLFGSGLKGYGEESGRGRRRHIANHAYEKDGQQRVRVMFHLKGDRAKGRAYAEVAKVEGVWDYRGFYSRVEAESVEKFSGPQYNRAINFPPEIDLLTLEELEKRVLEARRKIPEDFISHVTDSLTKILDDRRLGRIRALGLGNFSSHRSSVVQLVLLEAIRDKFSVSVVSSQDPVTSAVEKIYLERRGFDVLSATHVFEKATECSSQEEVTLLYMIHCECTLYNEIIRAYWTTEKLKSVILLGNCCVTMISETPEPILKSLPFVRSFASICAKPVEVKFESDFHAFSNTSIQFVDQNVEYLPVVLNSVLAEHSILGIACAFYLLRLINCTSAMLILKQIFPRLCAVEKAILFVSGIPLQSKRGSAKGSKPRPQFLWDKRHLEELTEGKYTHKPLRVNRLGGRDPETGHKVNQHIGGGYKFDYFMVDMHRRGPDSPNQTYDERVLEVRRDPNRSTFIALVAGANGKRWILATERMKAGQVISTSGHIPSRLIGGAEGNAYPLGALVLGTLVNSVEAYPSLDSEFFICQGGSCGRITRHEGDFVVVQMSHKHEYSLRKECMATVGRLSRLTLDTMKLQWGSPQMHRRFGYKMSSGLYHKKDGYQGRKKDPLPPVRVIDEVRDLNPPVKQKFTLTKKQLSAFHGPTQAAHPLVYRYMFRPQ
uniref:TIM21-like protein, mitochondrial n=1 Tax=Ditylenchus dipsaci TaxID=166011 RepID=A0A915EJ08_9BILA